VFAFKIIEYLAAGAHVMTTPMGEMEAGLEEGVTYLSDNAPNSIAVTLTSTIRDQRYLRTAASAAQRAYGGAAVSKALGRIVADSASAATRRGKPAAAPKHA
jgi:hypothetical protein